jgi:hypothetical protein
MRTKALLLTAAVIAAGIGTSVAQQVFSANAVGYVNVSLPVGFSMIANPLNGTNNTLSTILPTVPEFTELYPFDPASQQFLGASTYIGGEWDVNYTLNPGDGAFVRLAEAATVTFIGEVPQGNLSNPLSANFQIKASQVPQAGGLTGDLGYPAAEFDVVYKFDRAAQQFESAYTFIGGAWDPADPQLGLAESVFIQRTAGGNWTRTFNVNTP